MAWLQRALDDGEIFEAARAQHAVVFVEVDGALWSAVVKAADGGEGIFPQTLHRVRRYNLEAARRTLERIDRE